MVKIYLCLVRGADLLMPLPLTFSCFSKIQIGFTFLVPADLGSPRQRAVKRVCLVRISGAVAKSIAESRCAYLTVVESLQSTVTAWHDSISISLHQLGCSFRGNRDCSKSSNTRVIVTSRNRLIQWRHLVLSGPVAPKLS